MAIAGAKKAADNPAGSIFLAVLVGAVLLQGIKKIIPDLPDWRRLWDALPIPDFPDVTYPLDKTYEAIQITAALNEEILEGFENISDEGKDPIQNWVFGGDNRDYDDLSVEVWEKGEMGAVEKAYVGAIHKGLFPGVFNRGWNY